MRTMIQRFDIKEFSMDDLLAVAENIDCTNVLGEHKKLACFLPI